MANTNWYVVDLDGHTKGPMLKSELLDLYTTKQIHKKSYVWNGKTVKKWTPFGDTPIYNETNSNSNPKKNKNKSQKDSISNSNPKSNSYSNIIYSPNKNFIKPQPRNSKNINKLSKNDYQSQNQSNNYTNNYKKNYDNPINYHHHPKYNHEFFITETKKDIRKALMMNIQHGIKLRDVNHVPSIENGPPRLLKDEYGERLKRIITPQTSNNGSIEDIDTISSTFTKSINFLEKKEDYHSNKYNNNNNTNVNNHQSMSHINRINKMKQKLDKLHPIKDKKTLSIIEALLLN